MSTTPAPPIEQQRLVSWYLEHVRPLLADVAPDRAASCDERLERLGRIAQQRQEEWMVCFVGDAGVGKSTLLNALVAGHRVLLPQGGIGPLTAQATSVRFADRPSFHARYHGADRVNRLILALESHLKAQRRRQAEAPGVPASDSEQAVDEDTRRHLAEELAADDAGRGLADYQKQARLMIQGSPHGDLDLAYLIDGLRLCVERAPLFGRPLSSEDLSRVERVRSALGLARRRAGYERTSAGAPDPAFFRDLSEHATGCLAPIIRRLDVGWDADFLRHGLTLVDLPGLGVKGDVYKEVTQRFIREQARAVLLVVDRSGLKESSVDLLRQSGFFSRLLHALDSPDSDPVRLLVAMVRVDDVATDAYLEEKAKLQADARRWQEHFEEACGRARALVADQLRDLLLAMAEKGDARLRHEREQVVLRVLAQLEVHPVSAPEYRKLLGEDEDDRPRIRRPDESHVPQLAESLRGLAARRRAELEAAYQQALADLRLLLLADLALLGEQWGDQRAAEEAERLRRELEHRIAPLRLELEHRRGAFREFLRAGLPERISARLKEAEAAARDEMIDYLDRLGDAHWTTIRAAVRRGGTFSGARSIDIAGTLSTLLDEQIGALWAKSILADLRRRTREMADDSATMIDQVVAWAREQEARVNPRLVEALRDQMRADARALASVGKEAIDELQGRVQKQLYDRIDTHVQAACESFMASKGHQGPGVKVRILDFFRDLVPLAIQAAHRPAEGILLRNFAEVQAEIIKVFEARHADPLRHATDQLVSSHEERVVRSRRRKAVLEQLAAVLSRNPYPPLQEDAPAPALSAEPTGGARP